MARLEDVLEWYAEPLDAARPVVGMAELSKERHDQVPEPLPAPPGPAAKEDYAYQRNGTANGCVWWCPLLGGRHREVTAKRGYQEFAPLRKALGAVQFPKAETIRVVRDHRNTHVFGAWYEACAPAAARRSARRWEFHSTPKQGSWRNRAAREFRVLGRQGLDRRLATAEEWTAAIAAWERARNAAKTTLNGTFRVADARKKRHGIYPS